VPAQERWAFPSHAWRRLAEVGAVEVVRGAVSPPTPGTETWWRAAVREAVYALRQRGLVQYVWEAEVVNWAGPPC
jgi:hypothetical protein